MDGEMVMSTPLSFSIVIPTYRRPDRLRRCLQAVTDLTYPRPHFQVVVVNDGGEEPLEPLIQSFRPQVDVQLINQSNAGPAAARNAGAREATYPYLAFTDDDCTPHPDWLTQLAEVFQQQSDCLVGGHTVNGLPTNVFSTSSQLLVDYLYQYYNVNPQQAHFLTSNNFAIAAHHFWQVGGFDTTFPLAAGEDREFCDRWLSQHHHIVYADTAQVSHFHQLSLNSFWRQHFNYGRGAYHFHQIRARRHQGEMRVEPFSFYFNLLTYGFAHPSGHSPLNLMLLFVLSQVANVAGFFRERIRQQRGS